MVLQAPPTADGQQLKSVSRWVLPCPAVSVTLTTNALPRTPGSRHFADQTVTSPTTRHRFRSSSTRRDHIRGHTGPAPPGGEQIGEHLRREQRQRCSARNPNTLPVGSRCPVTESASNNSRRGSENPCIPTLSPTTTPVTRNNTRHTRHRSQRPAHRILQRAPSTDQLRRRGPGPGRFDVIRRSACRFGSVGGGCQAGLG